MVATRVGASRAASVFSNATARDRMRRRDKPYKTEQQKVVAKRRKLAINTSYLTKAPPGYTFLPVGTPDLAELCKELSRQRDLPVNVVNATPTHAKAADPGKLSHHVHRIGYHFASSVLEDACEQLEYLPIHGHYVKPIDLEKQNQQKWLGGILKKHGITSSVQQTGAQESPEQVRAAIRELFPRIPQADLDQIVTHAWAEGTGRVGSVEHLPLGRRVQLAVIARIRHRYTDYDQLLRAFGWADARQEVEPVTLRKLIEWRGENEEDNGELEEIVRETIVIDDEDEDAANSAIGMDDGDSTDAGNVSDTSLEISHRPAAAHDLRAEEANERDHRYLQRWQPPQRTLDERTNIARAKLNAARGQPMQPQPRTIVVPSASVHGTRHNPQPPYHGRFNDPAGDSASSTPLRPIIIPSDSAERARDARQWDQGSPHTRVQYVQRLEPVRSDAQRMHSPGVSRWPQEQVPSPRVRPPFGGSQGSRRMEEHALPSIERGDILRQEVPQAGRTGYISPGDSGQHSYPTTPENARPRFHLPGSAVHPYYMPVQNIPAQQPHNPGWHGEPIDLTSPDHRDVRRVAEEPEVRVVSSGDGRYQPVRRGYPLDLPAPMYPPRSQAAERWIPQDNVHRGQPAVGYDPAHPQLVDLDQDRRRYQEASRHPEPTQYLQQVPVDQRPQHQGRMPTRSNGQTFQPQELVYSYAGRPSAVFQVQSTENGGYRRLPPAPVHGEPAPVQQMQRPVRYAPYDNQGREQRASAYDYPYHDNPIRPAANAQNSLSGGLFQAPEPMYQR